MNTINNINQSSIDSMSTMSSSRSDVAPGTLQETEDTGCEDTVESKAQFKISKQLKLATWNCGGLKFTTQDMCKDLDYDVLVLTETHDKGNLKSSRNFKIR